MSIKVSRYLQKKLWSLQDTRRGGRTLHTNKTGNCV